MSNLNLRLQTIIPGGLIIILALAIWMYAGTFPELDDGYPGPALFPRIVAFGLGICGLILSIQSWQASSVATQTASTEPIDKLNWLRLLGGLGCMATFPLLYDWVGFITALAVSCLGIALLLKVKVWQALAVAIGSSMTIYFLFTKFLSVPL